MILGGPKDTITSLRTKGLKALVPPNSFGPPTMVGVVVDFKDRGHCFPKIAPYVCHTPRPVQHFTSKVMMMICLYCNQWLILPKDLD